MKQIESLKQHTLTVIIPVYNKVRTIREIIHRATNTRLVSEIIVVDDGSSDGTREILNKLAEQKIIKTVFHDLNMGKGSAIQSGLEQASRDLVLIQDTDLEYAPRDYPILLQPIQEDLADVVYGSRFMGGPRRPILF